MPSDDRTPEQRSETMRAIKSKNTKPEMALRSLVHGMGYRYRLHVQELPGKPDLVFPSRRKVIFLHGCFWHGHECSRGRRLPSSNQAYWYKKISGNVSRDKRQLHQLADLGWKALIVWECELKDTQFLSSRIKEFLG